MYGNTHKRNIHQHSGILVFFWRYCTNVMNRQRLGNRHESFWADRYEVWQSRASHTVEPWQALIIFYHKLSDGKVAIKSFYKNKSIRDERVFKSHQKWEVTEEWSLTLAGAASFLVSRVTETLPDRHEPLPLCAAVHSRRLLLFRVIDTGTFDLHKWLGVHGHRVGEGSQIPHSVGAFFKVNSDWH